MFYSHLPGYHRYRSPPPTVAALFRVFAVSFSGHNLKCNAPGFSRSRHLSETLLDLILPLCPSTKASPGHIINFDQAENEKSTKVLLLFLLLLLLPRWPTNSTWGLFPLTSSMICNQLFCFPYLTHYYIASLFM